MRLESIDKLGSMAFFIGGLCCATLLLLLIGKVIKKLGYSQKLIEKIKKKLFWNTFIRSSLQAYIKVLVVYLTMALALKFSSFSSSLSSIIVILVLSAMILLPIFYTAVLSKNR